VQTEKPAPVLQSDGFRITQAQLERDVLRTRKEIDGLKQREGHLLAALQLYFPDSKLLMG